MHLPTLNARRHFQTTPAVTPNQQRSARVLSVPMARESVPLTHSPDPARCSSGCTRGRGIRASVHDVTRQSRSR